METPAPDGQDFDTRTGDAGMGSTHQLSIHLLQGKNFLSSPLLRLPTELVLKIFAHTVDWGPGLSSLVLTAICHKLREVGIAFPQLWNVVSFTTPPLAQLFLERCNHDPRALLITESQLAPNGWRSVRSSVREPMWEVVWERLKGRTFNDLRSLVFEGVPPTFTDMVVGILRRAPNIANVDLRYRSPPHKELPWSIANPVPCLTTLRLRGFWISWTSPLLQNLTQLTLDFGIVRGPPEETTIETFLTALANCPDLETLDLAFAGPDLSNGCQDDCDRMVLFHKLQDLSLMFHGPSRIQHILSHIGFPESTVVKLEASIDADADLSEAISQLFSHRTIETLQRRRSNDLTVRLDGVYTFFTDKLFVRIFTQGCTRSRYSPQALARFASKITEVVGGDNITSLSIQTWYASFPEEMWDVFLHEFPCLERIRYDLEMGIGDERFADPFVSVFSRPFKGGLVCPMLQHLILPQTLMSQRASANALKRALAGRKARGSRLNRIGLSGDMKGKEKDGVVVLESFRGLVNDVS
jgi:hypothetical protein